MNVFVAPALGLQGGFQAHNLGCALAAMERIVGLDLTSCADALREALRAVRWPGRFSVVSERPWILVDGAHNPAGARALVDSKLFPQDDGGAYLAPQVLVDVDHSMTIMREETFGPAVGIMKVRDDAEALALMNDSKYGLTVSLWTGDAERAARLGEDLETGTVFMNRADYLDPALCWTGVKETGRGGSLSVIGFHNLTRPKSYHLRKALA